MRNLDLSSDLWNLFISFLIYLAIYSWSLNYISFKRYFKSPKKNSTGLAVLQYGTFNRSLWLYKLHKILTSATLWLPRLSAIIKSFFFPSYFAYTALKNLWKVALQTNPFMNIEPIISSLDIQVSSVRFRSLLNFTSGSSFSGVQAAFYRILFQKTFHQENKEYNPHQVLLIYTYKSHSMLQRLNFHLWL